MAVHREEYSLPWTPSCLPGSALGLAYSADLESCLRFSNRSFTWMEVSIVLLVVIANVSSRLMGYPEPIKGAKAKIYTPLSFSVYEDLFYYRILRDL